VRIIILGESAAAGTPEPAYGFGRILERMLQHRYPQRRIQVINAAMRGVNSHILRRVSRDCARLGPDLFVVYMGNNEVVGLHAPGPRSGRLTPYRRLLRAIQWVRATRVGQVLEPLLQGLNREAVTGESQDEAFFQERRLAADDPRRAAVYDNFRANLDDICRAARQAGAAAVLVTVAANLADSPPFGSLHRVGLTEPEQTRWAAAFAEGLKAETGGGHAQAISNYLAAAAVDGHFAELHYRLGRCYRVLGQLDQARQHFVLARDWDALQFRADSPLNEIVRHTASRLGGSPTRLVDFEQALAQSPLADHGIPGERLFHDHVHLNFDGDYALARALLPTVAEAIKGKLGQPPTSQPVLSREDCAARLAFTRLNEAQLAIAMLNLVAQPPFTSQMDHAARLAQARQKLAQRFGNAAQPEFAAAQAAFRAAAAQAPEDWQLPFNHARLLVLFRDYTGAVAQFQAARRLLPHSLPIRLGLSSALNAAGRHEEALRELQEAQALDPQSEAVKTGIAAVRAQRRRTAEP
jgi:tetratricopeptide (TPR) repeat protein